MTYTNIKSQLQEPIQLQEGLLDQIADKLMYGNKYVTYNVNVMLTLYNKTHDEMVMFDDLSPSQKVRIKKWVAAMNPNDSTDIKNVLNNITYVLRMYS